MQLPALLISDLHLTVNPRDEYRWKLFKWLSEECVYEKVKTLVILGDLTDAKDYHSAELINRVASALTMMTWLGMKVVVLQGNHDYLRKGHPTFEFIDDIPNCSFIKTMGELEYDEGPLVYCLPHTRTPLKDWAGLDFSHYDYVFMHQTAPGSLASNGQKMAGDELPSFQGVKVYSGDIHVPQVIGEVEYVGSPYHVHFGDRFKPRCVLIDSKRRAVDLHHPNISRLTLKITHPRDLIPGELGKGDQVKLRIELDAADKHEWKRLRREATEIITKTGAELFGVELIVKPSTTALKGLVRPRARSSILADPDAILRYVEREGLGAEVFDLGVDLIK